MSNLNQILEELQSEGKFESGNLEEHLTKIFSKLVLENSKNACSVLEEYSFQIKQLGIPGVIDPSTNKMKEPFNQLKDQLKNLPVLYNKINAGSQEEPSEPASMGFIPDFRQEAKLFEMGGIYFGDEETFKIQRSIARLCHIKQARQMRFWGKIFASQKDYYIAEGIAEGAEEQQQGEMPPNFEPKGTGVNKLQYWATNDLFEEWKELPAITPQQLIQSRQIKHMFTGNLEEKIMTNPFFFESEKYLLKAQIVRISFSTTIVPKNYYKIVEEEPKEIEPITEEFKAPTFSELCSLQNWHHLNQNILKEGRIIHMKPEMGPDDDEEKVMKIVEQRDPFEQRLKPLSKDKAITGIQKCWVLKTYGDTIEYKNPGKIESFTNYGYIIIKSQVWPGMTIAYHKSKWQQLYVGYGFKSSPKAFFYQVPEILQQEPIELKGQEEPRNPPVEGEGQRQRNDDDDY